MQIDWPIIRQQAMHRGVTMTRVAVRDFDHNDQVCIAKSCNQPHFTVCCGTAQCLMLCVAEKTCYAFAAELSAADL